MRALLVLNPHATTTDDATRAAIVARIATSFDLDVQPTKQRGHATHIVDGAIDEGIRAVFALGGDGTVNEVVQAMAGTDAVLGAIPGGGTNVFARALGLPNDAVAATEVLMDLVASNSHRSITLGRAAGRYFSFHAGFGFDAAVVRGVEQSPRLKRLLRQAAFVTVAARTLAQDTQRHDATLTLHTPGGDTLGPGAIAIIGNADPWTYLQRFPLHVTPAARFDLGLDVTLLGAISTARLARLLARAFRGRLEPTQDAMMVHDLDEFTLVSPDPRPLQVDGDYAGEHTQVHFRTLRHALRVWAPQS